MTLAGRYRVEQELGRGGMAKVYRGEDTVLGRTVAIKVLAPQYSDDPNFVTRFRREAQAAARISNQNLVSVFDTGSDDGVHFIVMEYVEGKTLAEFLTGGGRILPDRAIEIAIDVCRALEAAHAQGVIHRDIKPGNIMLDQRGSVKVTDFGIARMIATAETVAQTAAVLGTASYLSPEQAQGEPVDGRSDLYSLGCVLYEMVTGRPPFLGDSPVTVASKQVLEQPTPPSRLNRDVSPDLDAVILRALAKNPANRYQTAAEFRADLERIRRGLPVEATPLLPVEPGSTQVIAREAASRTTILPPSEQPEPPRSRWWIPVLVTLLILGLLGLVLFLLARNLVGNDNNQTQTVTVPNVVGERLNAAKSDLEAQGLKVPLDKVVRAPAPADQPDAQPGTVIAQDPPANQEVQAGTEVILTVVEQPGTVTLPTGLTGQDPQAVRDALLAVSPDFQITTQDEPSADVDTGKVTRIDPPEGTPDVAPDASITIFISSGPENVTVPDVRCRPFGAASAQLQSAGLNPVISDTTVNPNPLCPNPNRVAAQDPAPGTSVQPDSTVTLFGGAETTPPTGPTGPTKPTGGTGPTA